MIDDAGIVRFDLPVPDRLAHEYLLSIEPVRRYDALWERLARAGREHTRTQTV